MTYRVSKLQLAKEWLVVVICLLFVAVGIAQGTKAQELFPKLFSLGVAVLFVCIGILIVKNILKFGSLQLQVTELGVGINLGTGWSVFTWDFIETIMLVRFSPRTSWGYKLITVKVTLCTRDGKFTIPTVFLKTSDRAAVVDSIRQYAAQHAIPIQDGEEG